MNRRFSEIFSKSFIRNRFALYMVLLLGAIVHSYIFYFTAGPFNLFTDSAGYLSTADHFFESGELVFNPNRPVGLPLFFLFLLWISGYKLVVLVFFQIVFFISALLFAVFSAMQRSPMWEKVLVFLAVLFLSVRTFLYAYFILSEAIFASLLLIFLGFFLKYFFNLGKEVPSLKFLWGMFFSALGMALTKSIGILFLFLFFGILLMYLLKVRKEFKHVFSMIAILLLILLLNYNLLGVMLFSKQDGIQLLISANKYINYDTQFMSHEKAIIHDSHEAILHMYAPRTRLDQMIGPVDGLKTPSQILMEDSQYDYDVYNLKIRKIIFEGLFADGDWARYAMSGLHELRKMIVYDEKEGLIIPGKVSDSNEMVLSWLPFLQQKNENIGRNISNTFFNSYYQMFVSYGLLPKYVVPIIFFVVACVFLVKFSIKAFLPIFVFFGFIFLYIYFSVLLVFSLDRYYSGVETTMLVISIAMMHSIFSREPSNKKI